MNSAHEKYMFEKNDSRIFDYYNDIAADNLHYKSLMVKSGFGLLDYAADTALDIEMTGDAMSDAFETERIKEHISSWQTHESGNAYWLGYRSAVIDRMLADVGINRGDLCESVTNENVEHILLHTPWLRKLSRAARFLRASDAYRAGLLNELQRESDACAEPMENINVSLAQADRSIHDLLATHGYSKMKGGLGFLRKIYTKNDFDRRTVRFAYDIRKTKGITFPIRIEAFIAPPAELAIFAGRWSRFELRGEFFRPLERIAPGFSGYQLSWTPAQFMRCVHAYKKFFDIVIPGIEKRCA